MRRIRVIGFLSIVLLAGGGLFFLRPSAHDTDIGGAVTEDAARTEQPEEASSPDRVVEVPILVYHSVREFLPGDGPLTHQYNVTPGVFEAQLELLEREGFVSIGFAELEDAILRGGSLPEKPVILTFDDGSWTHYVHAFPALVAHGFTATFFPFSNAIDRPNYLTTAQIREMRDAGMTFGNHTRYHQYLTRLPEREAVEEIRAGKVRLEEVLEEEVDVIAYPFGLYDDRIAAAAAILGHRTGRTIEEGHLHGPEDLMTLKAYQVTDSLRRLEYALGK